MSHEEETRSLLNRAPREADAPRPTFLVSVVSGPDRGHAFELDGQAPRTLVGVSTTCTVRLTDSSVSRRHAALEVEDDGLRIQDLGSKNGTTINGLRITDALLAGGEVLRLGGTMLKVEKLARLSSTKMTSAMTFGRVVGASPEMRRLYAVCQDLSVANDPVLIEGETGTGKELLAEALHEKGSRAAGPFVVFDCASASGSGALAALFGVDGGAADSIGAFEQARGGTLLLDEIAELDTEAQAGVLDALAGGRILREGAKDWTPIDVRILVASRRDLDAEVQAGRFREDVLQHLAPRRIELPPLRKRKGDVALLARHFWRVVGGGDTVPADFAARLDGYAWPGNVRELANVVARRFANGDDELEASSEAGSADASLGAALEAILESDMPFSRARAAALSEFERRYVARVLARHGGHVGRAAAASGIARRYFQVLRGRSK